MGVDHRQLIWQPGNNCRRGISLIEVLMTITILLTISVMVLPNLSGEDGLRVRAAAAVLTSDIELAQVMTISYPNDPVIVKFRPEQSTYWLAYADNPETPLTRADTSQPYLVTLGQGRARTANDVAIDVTGIADDTIAFSAYGGLADLTQTPRIELSLENDAITLGVAPTTGTISEITQ